MSHKQGMQNALTLPFMSEPDWERNMDFDGPHGKQIEVELGSNTALECPTQKLKLINAKDHMFVKNI